MSTLGVWGVAALLLTTSGAFGADDPATATQRQLELLQEQNAKLDALVRQQQAVIDSLNQRVGNIEQAAINRGDAGATPGEPAGGLGTNPSGGFQFGKVNLSGEGGVGFFYSQPDGAYPNGEFRVDEAKLFIEAPVWKEVYFFTELDLAARNYGDLGLHLGELYLDFENVSQLWGHDRMLNVRVGRMDIPFGEEYIRRDVIDDPLISRSLSDLWGIDEGLELYGGMGKFNYVAAVQNGGFSGTRDYNSDKSVAGRLSYDPTRWLHLSASGMRTGNLDATDDYWSELWFGNAWLGNIGSSNTTTFRANLAEGDIVINLPRGYLRAFGGYLHYTDNDPDANNSRDVYYYCIEPYYSITKKFYAAARFSQVFAPKGFTVVGNGTEYAPVTDMLWQLSLGLGYRFSERLVIKAEYTFTRGHELDGTQRDNEDFFGAQAAFKF